jgi:hypothetical protein
MGGQISQFYSVLQTVGVAYSYQYKLELELPTSSNVSAAYSKDRSQNSRVSSQDASLDFNLDIFKQQFLKFSQTAGGMPISIFAQSTSLPSKSVSEVELSYQGFGFSFPNTLSFDRSLSINVYSDAKYNLHSMFEDWQRYYASLNLGGGGYKTILDGGNAGSSTVGLFLLDSNLGSDAPDITMPIQYVKYYKLVGCWPKSIGALSVSHSNFSVASFDVTLVYQYFVEVDTGATNNSAFNDIVKRQRMVGTELPATSVTSTTPNATPNLNT